MILMMFMYMLNFPLEIEKHNLVIINKDAEIQTIEKAHFSLLDIDELFIDRSKLNALTDKLSRHVYKKPINAMLDDKGNIIPEQPGTMLDRNKFTELFYTYFYQQTLNNIELPTEAVFPRVDSELLAEISVNKIGEFLTHFREGNEERSHNISLSAQAINNYVVFPGEKFSFNEVVGERTVEKGYKKAPVIVKGELTEDIGGGICQVSSTLFNAVSLEGIQITERYSHSREVPYVQPGRDAAVSWWGPDFAFINQYDSPILIRAFSNSGKLIVSIYSSEIVHMR